MLSLEELNSLLTYATGPRDSFYRHLYKMNDDPARSITSLDEWRTLPVLTKDDLLAQPLRKRSYKKVLDHLRASSGTSGKPPLFSPRTYVQHMDYRLQYHDFENAFLGFTVPLMPHWHAAYQKEHGLTPRVISYDPKYAAASVRLAKAAGVDAFSVFVYHVLTLGEHMKREGMNERIRFIEITGETCSRAQFDYIRATFPNATLLQSYNSSEVEDAHIGMPCKPIDGTEPLAVYHPKSSHYLELIDPATSERIEPVAGAEGDLLVSAYPGEAASFPLIRFRIGDMIRIVEAECPHGSWSFTVLGRTDMDFLKVPGGVLRADEIARVLRLFPERVSDRFELHCSEEATSTGPKLKPVLHIETLAGTDLQALAKDIAKNLRVAPAFTYADGVANNRYLSLICSPLVIAPGAKTKRIVQH